MANEKKIKKLEKNEGVRKSLFTGNVKRDTVVSESEKIAEASCGIFDWIKGRIKRRRK